MANPMDSAALYRLMAWLSPSYPVGAFSYSHGLEWLVETGELSDCATMVEIISDLVVHGSGRNDAILLSCAHRAVPDPDKLLAINEMALALSAGSERHLETSAQGKAFATVTDATWSAPSLALFDGAIAYPVAVGAAFADHQVDRQSALHAYLHAFAANLVSAGLRLVPLGHTDGQRAMIALEPVITQAAEAALSATLDDIGGACFRADMASSFHETQYTRLFRT